MPRLDATSCKAMQCVPYLPRISNGSSCKMCGHETKPLTYFTFSATHTSVVETMTSTTMRKHSRSAMPLPVAAVVAIIGLLIRPAFSFVVVANDSRGSFQSPVMTSRSTSSLAATSPLFMTFTMPLMPKLDFNAPSAANNGAIWYESCVDPKARLPDYAEE